MYVRHKRHCLLFAFIFVVVFSTHQEFSRVRPLTRNNIISVDFSRVQATTCTVTSEVASGSPKHQQGALLDVRHPDRYFCGGLCDTKTSSCFLGYCLCHPGYEGLKCDRKKSVPNPWYTDDCPNLSKSAGKDGNALDLHVPLSGLGGKRGCPVAFNKDSTLNTGLSYCAYLCYSNELYGVPIVPLSIWKAAQEAEDEAWKVSQGDGDRYSDHWEGYDEFASLPSTTSLGSVIEFGAGPWTQFRGLLHKRPDLLVRQYTIFEPGADYYVQNVQTCAYRSGKLEKYRTQGVHSFPVEIISSRGESFTNSESSYDTVISINVIEHVQNAVEYLHSLHAALRPGGILIFHERFYDTPRSGDAVLGQNIYHPIRLTKLMFDVFLSDFEIIYNNCDGHNRITGWLKRGADEHGYYVIAKKR